MNYVKKGWDDIKQQLKEITELYTREETYTILLKDDYYKTLFGKSKNRTLIKENPKLYNSIYYHTNVLKTIFDNQHSYFGNYKFTKRIQFITERKYDVKTLKCICNRTYTWNTNCRYCPEVKKTMLGKIHTHSTKTKQRVSTLKYIKNQNGQIQPRYNINSISIIEEYGKKHNYNFQHAENGGEYHIKELGYFIDAYDKEKNVVLEIDEKYHKKQKIKDKCRQQEIEEFLKCKFIRIPI